MKKNVDDLVRVHILMDRADHQRLMDLFKENPGYSQAIRRILRSFLVQVDSRVDGKAPEVTEELAN